jgi:hypothetical protein
MFALQYPLRSSRGVIAVSLAEQPQIGSEPDMAGKAVTIMIDHHVSDIALLWAVQLAITVVSKNVNQVRRIDPRSPAGYHHADTIVRRRDRAENGIRDKFACQLNRGSEGGGMAFGT